MAWLPDNPEAARVLGKIGPDAKVALPLLEKVYRDKTGPARIWSAFALVKLTRKSEPYVTALAQVFERDKNPDHRRAALEALAELGSDARAALPTFLMALRTRGGRRDSDFQDTAATALARFGVEAKEAIPDLIDMVKNSSSYPGKIAAARCLASNGPAARKAIPALESMAEEYDGFRPVVEKALARIRAK